MFWYLWVLKDIMGAGALCIVAVKTVFYIMKTEKIMLYKLYTEQLEEALDNGGYAEDENGVGTFYASTPVRVKTGIKYKKLKKKPKPPKKKSRWSQWSRKKRIG